MMIRQRSFPVDDTVLILAEPYLKEKAPAVAQTLGEVFAAVLNSFMEQGISCQAGVFDHSTGHFYIEKYAPARIMKIFSIYSSATEGRGKSPAPSQNIFTLRDNKDLQIIFILRAHQRKKTLEGFEPGAR